MSHRLGSTNHLKHRASASSIVLFEHIDISATQNNINNNSNRKNSRSPEQRLRPTSSQTSAQSLSSSQLLLSSPSIPLVPRVATPLEQQLPVVSSIKIVEQHSSRRQSFAFIFPKESKSNKKNRSYRYMVHSNSTSNLFPAMTRSFSHLKTRPSCPSIPALNSEDFTNQRNDPPMIHFPPKISLSSSCTLKIIMNQTQNNHQQKTIQNNINPTLEEANVAFATFSSVTAIAQPLTTSSSSHKPNITEIHQQKQNRKEQEQLKPHQNVLDSHKKLQNSPQISSQNDIKSSTLKSGTHSVQEENINIIEQSNQKSVSTQSVTPLQLRAGQQISSLKHSPSLPCQQSLNLTTENQLNSQQSMTKIPSFNQFFQNTQQKIITPLHIKKSGLHSEQPQLLRHSLQKYPPHSSEKYLNQSNQKLTSSNESNFTGSPTQVLPVTKNALSKRQQSFLFHPTYGLRDFVCSTSNKQSNQKQQHDSNQSPMTRLTPKPSPVSGKDPIGQSFAAAAAALASQYSTTSSSASNSPLKLRITNQAAVTVQHNNHVSKGKSVSPANRKSILSPSKPSLSKLPSKQYLFRKKFSPIKQIHFEDNPNFISLSAPQVSKQKIPSMVAFDSLNVIENLNESLDVPSKTNTKIEEIPKKQQQHYQQTKQPSQMELLSSLEISPAGSSRKLTSMSTLQLHQHQTSQMIFSSERQPIHNSNDNRQAERITKMKIKYARQTDSEKEEDASPRKEKTIEELESEVANGGKFNQKNYNNLKINHSLKRPMEQTIKIFKATVKLMQRLNIDPAEVMAKKIFSSRPFEKEYAHELFVSVKANHVDEVLFYLKQNKYLVHDFDFIFLTSLHWACKRGFYKIAQILIAHNADIEAEDIMGRTPLSLAIEFGYEDVVELLLINQASPYQTKYIDYVKMAKTNTLRKMLTVSKKLHCVMRITKSSERASYWKKESCLLLSIRLQERSNERLSQLYSTLTSKPSTTLP